MGRSYKIAFGECNTCDAFVKGLTGLGHVSKTGQGFKEKNGEGGIRTLGTSVHSYDGLANRWLKTIKGWKIKDLQKGRKPAYKPAYKKILKTTPKTAIVQLRKRAVNTPAARSNCPRNWPGWLTAGRGCQNISNRQFLSC